jgi:hypothetical protein
MSMHLDSKVTRQRVSDAPIGAPAGFVAGLMAKDKAGELVKRSARALAHAQLSRPRQGSDRHRWAPRHATSIDPSRTAE